MDYITTVSGIHFTPTAPQSVDILIEDIAHALSLLCRANGHFPTFFSVAQHSINCAQEAEAKGYPPRVRLACLLHDASEAYISDLTRPVKRNLPKYRVFEAALQKVIYKKYLGSDLTAEEQKLVDAIDDAQLYYEFQHFGKEWEFDDIPALKGCPQYGHLGFTETEASFLERFRTLTGLLKEKVSR